MDISTVRAAVDDLAARNAAHNEKTAAAVATLEKGLKALNDNFERVDAVLKRPNGVRLDDEPGQPGDLKAERKALAVFARQGDDSRLREIHAAMHTGSDPDGGYLVTPAMSSGMTKRLYDESPMRRLARVETITTGSSWIEPLDIGEPEAKWVGEREARPQTASPGLGALEIQVHEIYANLPVTQTLLEDAGFDLGGWIDGKITDKFVRAENAAWLTGSGVNKPRGLLTYASTAAKDMERPWGTLQYLASGNATAITADALIDIVWTLRSPYRTGASWLMNSNTAAALDKLKDTTGNYLWRPSLVAGAQPTLLGYPVEIDEGMPDVAAGSTPVAFGNFKLSYVIVDRVGTKFLRDPYTSKPNVLFYAYRRVGGGLANSEAVKLLKVGTA